MHILSGKVNSLHLILWIRWRGFTSAIASSAMDYQLSGRYPPEIVVKNLSFNLIFSAIVYPLLYIKLSPFTLNSPKNLEGFGGTAYLAFTNFRLPSSKRI